MYPLGACTREGKELTSPFWGAFASGLARAAGGYCSGAASGGHRPSAGAAAASCCYGRAPSGGLQASLVLLGGAAGFSGSAPSGQAAALVLHCYPATLLYLPSTATRKWLLELELVSY
jgi:anaerobic selenocysteine-containing dehydrogenase